MSYAHRRTPEQWQALIEQWQSSGRAAASPLPAFVMLRLLPMPVFAAGANDWLMIRFRRQRQQIKKYPLSISVLCPHLARGVPGISFLVWAMTLSCA